MSTAARSWRRCSCRSSSTTGRSSRSRRSRTRSTPKAASSQSSSGTRACGASPLSSRRPPTIPMRPGTRSRRARCPLGEFPGASTPKELDEDEIEELLEAFGSAAVRAFAAGLDGVELHLSHGYLPWQFISPLYNKRTDRWGGSLDNRLRFPLEALKRMRAAAGDDRFVGYRINSTSFWPGDLEIDEVREIVAEIEKRADIDYVNVSAGVHHAFIHTPDGVRGRLGARLRPQDPRGLVQAGAAGGPHHHAGRGRTAAGSRRRRCHLPRPSALHRPPLGQEGRGGPHRRHSCMRRRQFLLEEREPGRPRSVHLQPHRRPRREVGRGHAGQGGRSQVGAGRRRRPGRAGIRASRVGPRPQRHALRGRGRDRRPRAGAVAAAHPGRVRRDRPLARGAGREERHPHRHRCAGDGGGPGSGAGLGEARPRGGGHGVFGRRSTASRAGPARGFPAGRPAIAWAGMRWRKARPGRAAR